MTALPVVGDGGMMMLNHPWGDPLFGRDIGYLRAIKFDPRKRVEKRPMLTKRPGGLHRNMDWNVIEVINGSDMSELMQTRVLWHSLLAQGFIAPGTGNSDSHGMTDGQLGWARNWVQDVDDGRRLLGGDVRRRDSRRQARRGQRHRRARRALRPRRRLQADSSRTGDELKITVKRAAVDSRRGSSRRDVEGHADHREGAAAAGDPFGNETTRYSARSRSTLTKDDFVIVEAGMRYPLAADLDDDGVPDTTDNNRDGVVDLPRCRSRRSIRPLVAPPDPVDPADPRSLITRMTPGAWPEGFANPLLVDVDGNGWTPPGL